MKRILAFLTLLAFLPHVAYSVGAQNVSVVGVGMCVSNATDLIVSGQGLLIGAIIGLTIVAIALAYAFGISMNNASAVVFAKDEIYHLGFSILMLLGFSGMLVFSCGLLGGFYAATFPTLNATTCFHTGDSINTVASCYAVAAQQDARTMSQNYVNQYVQNMMDSTYTVSIQIPLLNAYTATTGAYKRIVSNQYNMVFSSFLVPALMSISMQVFALNFINDNVISWVLPAAFMLRFFVPTRQMGNILIALAVGFYIIVPFMYVFNLAMYNVVFTDCSAAAPATGGQTIAQAVCDNAVDGYNCGTPSTTCSNPDSFFNVARLLPQAFFLPNLTIAILITFMTAMNKAMKVIG